MTAAAWLGRVFVTAAAKKVYPPAAKFALFFFQLRISPMASRRPTVHTLVLVLVLQAMIARAQTPQEPYAELQVPNPCAAAVPASAQRAAHGTDALWRWRQMKMSMLQERNSPCKDTDGTKYTTSRLVDRLTRAGSGRITGRCSRD